MNKRVVDLQKLEFEARIFVSLAIVTVFCLLSWPVFRAAPNNIVLAGSTLGLSANHSLRIGYLLIAFLLLVATLLRMWAGSVLSAPRIMAFRVQKDVLITTGPYALIRNPIYLADLIAFCAFSLVLEPIALALPVVLFLHYLQLIKYEERSLEDRFGVAYRTYRESTPRFLPSLLGFRRLGSTLKSFHVDYEGFRHNALYLLFVPGFLVAAATESFLHAFLIGIVGLADWAVLHIRVGRKPYPGTELKSSSGGVFDSVLYAQCWEDPDIDREALQITSDDVVFSITSGGCNLLAFLADDPRKIIALDVNPFQNYLLELKMAAFRMLAYEELLAFVGVAPCSERLATYRTLRPRLGEESRLFWDANPELIEGGIIHGGRYEQYLKLLRTWLGRLLGRSLFKELFAVETPEERKELFEKRWDNVRWHLFTRIFLSRTVMTLLFDKAFFAQLKEDFSFGRHFERIARRAITGLPLERNPYLAYILLGTHDSLERLPAYLQRSNYQQIRERLDRIEIITGSCQDFFAGLPPGSITKFNFSNIFEWMPVEAFESLLADTIRVARDGAILTYRNLLVPRSRPESLSTWIVPQQELAQRLHRQDLSFIYQAYIVERIVRDHGLPS